MQKLEKVVYVRRISKESYEALQALGFVVIIVGGYNV